MLVRPYRRLVGVRRRSGRAARSPQPGQGAGIVCHIEHFWCALRQRCGRFVQKTLSFCPCIQNHIGALWYFVRHDNASLLWGHYPLLLVGADVADERPRTLAMAVKLADPGHVRSARE